MRHLQVTHDEQPSVFLIAFKTGSGTDECAGSGKQGLGVDVQ